MRKMTLILFVSFLFIGCSQNQPQKRELPSDLMEKSKKEDLLLAIIKDMDTSIMVNEFKDEVEKMVSEIEVIRLKKDKSDEQMNSFINIYESYYK